MLCEPITQRTEDNPGMLDFIFFSDETHCDLCGHVNTQNMRFWVEVLCHELAEHPLSQEKMTVYKS